LGVQGSSYQIHGMRLWGSKILSKTRET
jgi:hypothetical protein